MRSTIDAEAAVQTVFKKHFGYTPPHVVKAPGRLEVLGNHTRAGSKSSAITPITMTAWSSLWPWTDTS